MTDKILCEIESFATEGIFRLSVSNEINKRYEDFINGIDIYLKRKTYTMVSLWIQDPKLSWISLGEFVTDSKYHAIREIISKLKLYFQEDTMTNMTKAELEQKYWEAQRRIDETDNKKKPKEFREILVRECFGRPYYEILYKEDGKMHVGYSSYKLDKVSEWLKEFFID